MNCEQAIYLHFRIYKMANRQRLREHFEKPHARLKYITKNALRNWNSIVLKYISNYNYSPRSVYLHSVWHIVGSLSLCNVLVLVAWRHFFTVLRFFSKYGLTKTNEYLISSKPVSFRRVISQEFHYFSNRVTAILSNQDYWL